MKKIIVTIAAIIAIIAITAFAFAFARSTITENAEVSHNDSEALRHYIEDSIVSVHRIDDGLIEVVIDTPDGSRFVHYDDGLDV